MADVTIGELPALNTMEASTLIPVEHDGTAKSMSGTVLENYVYGLVEDDVDEIAAIVAVGPKGDDGVSPTVTTSKEGGTATVTITDADGAHSFTVEDGDVSMEELTQGSASGNIASFTRLTNGLPLSGIKVDINPVQAGSGTPAPDNVRAISGTTQTHVTAAGRNLLIDNKTYPITQSGITTNRNADGSYQITGNKTSSSAVIFLFNFADADAISTSTQFDYRKWLPNGNYKAIVATEGLPSGAIVRLQVYGYSSLAAPPTLTALANSDSAETSFSVTDDYPFIVCRLYFGSGTYSNLNFKLKPMIVRADETDTSWDAPYSSKTIPYKTNGTKTVYGGYLEWEQAGKWKLTSTHVLLEMDGTTANYKFTGKSGTSGINEYYIYALADAYKYNTTANHYVTLANLQAGGFYCSVAPVMGGDSSTNAYEATVATNSAGNLQPRIRFLTSDTIQDVTAANAWLASLYANGTPCVFCYRLAEPEVTYVGAGSASVIYTLLGENNIWSDTGPVYVQFDEDIKRYIQDTSGIFVDGIVKGDGTGATSKAVAGTDYVDPSDVGAASGIATLDAYSKVTATQATARQIDISSNTTLNATHNGCRLRCSNGVTITVPSTLSAGYEVEIWNYGNSGSITISPATGVTLSGNSTDATLTSKYDVAVLAAFTATDWAIKGDI